MAAVIGTGLPGCLMTMFVMAEMIFCDNAGTFVPAVRRCCRPDELGGQNDHQHEKNEAKHLARV